VLQQVSFV